MAKFLMLVFGATSCILLFILGSKVEGAKILFYFGISTYSHRIGVWPLVEKLSARGHEVTFFSPYPPKKVNKNVTEFIPASLQSVIERFRGPGSDLIKLRVDGKHLTLWNDIFELGITMCEALMVDPEYVTFMTNHHFDLVVVDALHNECGYGIAHYHKSKIIIFDTTHPFQWQADMFGMPAESSWIPDMSGEYPQKMNFLERVQNTWKQLLWYLRKIRSFYPRMEKIMNKGLNYSDENSIDLREVELRQTALILTNTHYTIEYARSLPPLVVPIGGMHVSSVVNPLPEKFEKFLRKWGDTGFIYISFGTAAQISKAKPETQQVFFNAISSFNVPFIWKWEGDVVPANMPANVLTSQWMPQNDVLGHPKIKGFITHGGLLSIQEATFHGVPLIVFPFFAEQDFNAERIENTGNGIRLEFVGLRENQLSDAIGMLLTDPKYDQKMKEISELFKDRPANPLDTAVWWTEYVLRHTKEATALLKPLSVYQPWFTRRHLDVWGLQIATLFFVLGIFVRYKSIRSKAVIVDKTGGKLKLK